MSSRRSFSIARDNWRVAGQSPLLLKVWRGIGASRAVVDHEPSASRGPPDGEIALSITIEVARQGRIAVQSPLLLNIRRGIRAPRAVVGNEPRSGRRAPNSEIG